MIGLSDEPEGKVRAMKQPRIDYAVAIEPGHFTKDALQVSAIPHAILIDPKGIVRWEGYPLLPEDPLTEAAVQQIIETYSGHSD